MVLNTSTVAFKRSLIESLQQEYADANVPSPPAKAVEQWSVQEIHDYFSSQAYFIASRKALQSPNSPFGIEMRSFGHSETPLARHSDPVAVDDEKGCHIMVTLDALPNSIRASLKVMPLVTPIRKRFDREFGVWAFQDVELADKKARLTSSPSAKDARLTKDNRLTIPVRSRNIVTEFNRTETGGGRARKTWLPVMMRGVVLTAAVCGLRVLLQEYKSRKKLAESTHRVPLPLPESQSRWANKLFRG
mmetsp:Transcript_20774/g.45523  ORF Transcript_20774/g.45523 Transcript_20774/m.45523 type:complete len:247 (+) Transcript_20774:191-931(+)